jgi:phenylacetate-CoA ligase
MKDQIDFIYSFLVKLRETQYLPRDALLQYQRGLLERLVRHARAYVPFYRDTGRLDPLFQVDGSINWERWTEIPLLTRADVQRAGEALHAEVLPLGEGPVLPFSTSGSTGEPITVLKTQKANALIWTALLLRDLQQHQIDTTRRLAYLHPYTPSDFDITGTRRQRAWFPSFIPLGLHGERFELADTRPVTELIDAVVEIQPSYLYLQAIVLEQMIAFDKKGRLQNLNLAGVFSHGEHLSAQARQQIERYLGCKILDWYGSNECGRIAVTCAECDRMHVQEETIFAEVIGDDGIPEADNEGWLVVTPIYSLAMPLIRYDHADRVVVGAPGRCRVTLRALDAVLGKERTPFIFPDGTTIRPTLPTESVIEFLGARGYQVAQVAPDRCEFRIVPGEMMREAMRFDEMTALIRSIWWPHLNVEYRIVESLPRKTPRGKLAVAVREFGDGNGMPAAGRETTP